MRPRAAILPLARILLPGLLSASLLLAGCDSGGSGGRAPTAAFSVTGDELTGNDARAEGDALVAGNPIEFVSTSGDDEDKSDLKFAWDFDGNGQIDSRASDPTFTYEKGGFYDVVLTATSAEGKAARASKRMLVHNPTLFRVESIRVEDLPFEEFSSAESSSEAGEGDGLSVAFDVLRRRRFMHQGEAEEVRPGDLPFSRKIEMLLADPRLEYRLRVRGAGAPEEAQVFGEGVFISLEGGTYPSAIVLDNVRPGLQVRLDVHWTR